MADKLTSNPTSGKVFFLLKYRKTRYSISTSLYLRSCFGFNSFLNWVIDLRITRILTPFISRICLARSLLILYLSPRSSSVIPSLPSSTSASLRAVSLLPLPLIMISPVRIFLVYILSTHFGEGQNIQKPILVERMGFEPIFHILKECFPTPFRRTLHI